MKTLREELIKIIVKYLHKVFKMGLKQSPFDGDNSDFYAPFIELDIAPNCYKELEPIINSNKLNETKYIITFEDGTHYISSSYNQNDIKALNDGIITIVRQSDLKELTLDNEWMDLEKWVSG